MSVADDDKAERAELVWCDDCGQGLPWKHSHQPTARRRLVRPLVRWLRAGSELLESCALQVTSWADRPAKALYDIVYETQWKARRDRIVAGRAGRP